MSVFKCEILLIHSKTVCVCVCVRPGALYVTLTRLELHCRAIPTASKEFKTIFSVLQFLESVQLIATMSLLCHLAGNRLVSELSL